MMAPRVNVIRLERMLYSVDDCGVRAADVGAAAMAREREAWRRAKVAVCGCLDVVVSKKNRRGRGKGAAGIGRCGVEWRKQVGEGGRI